MIFIQNIKKGLKKLFQNLGRTSLFPSFMFILKALSNSKHNETSAFFLMLRGNLFKANGDYLMAAEEYSKASLLNPGKKSLYGKLGSVYNRIGNWVLAGDSYIKLLKMNDWVSGKHWNSNLIKILNNSLYFLEKENLWEQGFSIFFQISEDEKEKNFFHEIISLVAGYINRDFSKSEQKIRDLDLVLLGELKAKTARFSELNYNRFPFWLAIYRALFLSGFVRSAYQAKEYAALSILSLTRENCLDMNDLFIRSSALLFLDRQTEMVAILNEIVESAQSDKDRIIACKILVQSHECKEQGKYWRLIRMYARGRYGKAYPRLITGKSVAFVGPADSGLVSGSDIDSFDVVIRPNMSKNLTDVDFRKKFGTKQDVVYLNVINDRLHGDNLRKRITESGCKWVVARLPEIVKKYNKYISSRHDTPNNTSCDTLFKPLALLRIYTDVLPLNPQRFKIFAVDFFSGKSFYNNQYVGKNEGDIKAQQDGFHLLCVHDPLINFLLAKSWMKNENTEFDPSVKNVFSLSREEYLSILAENLAFSCSQFRVPILSQWENVHFPT